MISEEDKQALRIARTELTKRYVDVSRADVRLNHGVLHIRGIICKSPGAPYGDLHIEMEHIVHALRTKGAIREVSLEVTYA